MLEENQNSLAALLSSPLLVTQSGKTVFYYYHHHSLRLANYHTFVSLDDHKCALLNS